MNCLISPEDLKELLHQTALQAAQQVLAENGVLKDEISQRRAFQLFGRSNIESMRATGVIKRIGGLGGNSKCLYSRSEIESAIKTKHIRIKYVPS